MPLVGRSEQLATAAREELLQQRVSAAEDTAARASATAASLREEAGRLGTANGKLNADCETLRGRLSEAEPALAACQAQLQVSAVRVVVSHEAGSRRLRHNKSSSVLCIPGYVLGSRELCLPKVTEHDASCGVCRPSKTAWISAKQ